MKVKTVHLTRIVERGSPWFQEGAWSSPEFALIGAAVSHWLADLVQEARRQMTDEGRLWINGNVRVLLVTERWSIDAMAGALGLGSIWIDRILDQLGLSFFPIQEAMSQ